MIAERRLINSGWQPERAEKFAKTLDGLSPRQQNAAVNRALVKPNKRHTSRDVPTDRDRVAKFVERQHERNRVTLAKRDASDAYDRDASGRFSSFDSLGYAAQKQRMAQVQGSMASKTANRQIFASDAAEDLAQDAWLKSLEAGNTDKSFVIRTGQNKLIDDRRKEQRVQQKLGYMANIDEQLALGDDKAVASAEDEALRFEVEEQPIVDAFQSLSGQQQQMVSLVDLQGYKQREAAEELGIALGTAQSDLFRARKALREAKESFFDIGETSEFFADPTVSQARTVAPVQVQEEVQQPAQQERQVNRNLAQAQQISPEYAELAEQWRQRRAQLAQEAKVREDFYELKRTQPMTTRAKVQGQYEFEAFKAALAADQAREEELAQLIAEQNAEPYEYSWHNKPPPGTTFAEEQASSGPPEGVSYLERTLRPETGELRDSSLPRKDRLQAEELLANVANSRASGPNPDAEQDEPAVATPVVTTQASGPTPMQIRAVLRNMAAQIEAMPYGDIRNAARALFFQEHPEARKYGVIIKRYNAAEEGLNIWRRQ